MGSLSSSIKFEVKGMLKILPWTSKTSAGTEASLGEALVMSSLNVYVMLAGKLSEIVTEMTYLPESVMDVDFTSIWNSVGFVKIPPGRANAAPALYV
jgi:hypothetical protein